MAQTENLLSRQISKTKSINQMDFFWLIEKYYFGTNCLIRSKTETV